MDTTETAASGESGVSAAVGLAELERLVDGRAPRVRLYGCRGAFAALTVARLAARLAAGERPLVVVTPTETRAVELVRDLAFFLPARHVEDPLAGPRVMHLHGLETAPWADVSPDRRAILRRMAT